MSKNFTWHKIAGHINELNFANNSIAVIDVDGKKICVGNHAGNLFAFAYKCPHAGSPLSDGHIDPLGNIVCPLHHYRYDMTSGRNVSGEGYHLKNWPVEKREDGIYVGLETGGIFGLFI